MATEVHTDCPSELRFSCPFLEPVTPYIDPATAYTPIGSLVVCNIYERLVERRTDSAGRTRFIASLAEDWSISADFLRFSFRLRKDARFASGRRVTADAVRFSLERLIKIGENPPKSNPIARASSRYVPLKEVRARGENRVDLIMKASWATSLLGVSSFMCSILDESSIRLGNDLGHHWLRRHSAGSGPYVLQQISEHRVVLVSNPSYRGGEPEVARVVLLDGPDPAKEEAKVRRGTIDITVSATPKGIVELAASGFATKRVPTLLLPTFTVVDGTSGPDGRPLGESRSFMLALKQSIDYDRIARCFGGWSQTVQPAQTSVLKGMAGYRPNLAYRFKRKVAEAKRLLANAGYPRGVDVDLTYWGANWGGVDNLELVRIIRSNLRDVGIRTRVKKYTGKDYFEIPVEKIPALTLSMSGYLIPDPDDLMRRRMTWINISGHDYRAEEEFAAALEESDPKKRAAIYGVLQERYLREGAGIYLLTFPFNVAINPRVRGYDHPPHWGGPDFAKLSLIARKSR
jgi:peptide/nickel transport system substrate-binding protein